MHEASLAGGVLKVVEDVARREGFRRVVWLRLEVGQLAGVEVRALRFALEAISPGTCLQDAQFEIDEPAGQAWCLPCGESVTLPQRGQGCPRCGGHQLQPTGGTELRILEMRVADEAGEGSEEAPEPQGQDANQARKANEANEADESNEGDRACA